MSIRLGNFLFVFLLTLSNNVFAKVPGTFCSKLDKKSFEGLRVSVLDVGQGESVLINCSKERFQVLFDSGDFSERYPDAEERLYEGLLKSMGDDRVIEYAINSHPHPDHVNGFLSLLRGKSGVHFEFKNYIDNGSNFPESSVEEKVRSLVKNNPKSSYINTLKDNLDSLEICPSLKNVSLEFIQLTNSEYKKLGCPEDLNNCSIVAKLKYKNFSLLLLADTTTSWEKIILKRPNASSLLSSTIMTVGHHGADSSSSEFLETVMPKIAIISSGKPETGTNKKLGYPRRESVARINKYFYGQSKIKTRKKMLINTCKREGSSCIWTRQLQQPALFSTAHQGTIDVYVLEDKLCIESSTEKKVFELNFN